MSLPYLMSIGCRITITINNWISSKIWCPTFLWKQSEACLYRGFGLGLDNSGSTCFNYNDIMGDLDKENWISWYNIPISKYTYNEKGFSSVSEEHQMRNIMFKFYMWRSSIPRTLAYNHFKLKTQKSKKKKKKL